MALVELFLPRGAGWLPGGDTKGGPKRGQWCVVAGGLALPRASLYAVRARCRAGGKRRGWLETSEGFVKGRSRSRISQSCPEIKMSPGAAWPLIKVSLEGSRSWAAGPVTAAAGSLSGGRRRRRRKVSSPGRTWRSVRSAGLVMGTEAGALWMGCQGKTRAAYLKKKPK